MRVRRWAEGAAHNQKQGNATSAFHSVAGSSSANSGCPRRQSVDAPGQHYLLQQDNDSSSSPRLPATSAMEPHGRDEEVLRD